MSRIKEKELLIVKLEEAEEKYHEYDTIEYSLSLYYSKANDLEKVRVSKLMEKYSNLREKYNVMIQEMTYDLEELDLG